MDILGISYLSERICVDTDATFLQEDEVSQNKLHDFSFCLPGGLPIFLIKALRFCIHEKSVCNEPFNRSAVFRPDII